jgi:flagellar FliL protein
MPAIRNNVLMVLAHKTSEELLTREGKEKLAAEIRRESVRPMGIELDDEDEYADAPARTRRAKRRPVYSPVVQVHFSNFIVQ